MVRSSSTAVVRSSSTAHDVIREFRILDAIKDTGVRIPRPIVACDDPEVFDGRFYVMERIDGESTTGVLPPAVTVPVALM